jgi:hypothetical protein
MAFWNEIKCLQHQGQVDEVAHEAPKYCVAEQLSAFFRSKISSSTYDVWYTSRTHKARTILAAIGTTMGAAGPASADMMPAIVPTMGSPIALWTFNEIKIHLSLNRPAYMVWEGFAGSSSSLSTMFTINVLNSLLCKYCV